MASTDLEKYSKALERWTKVVVLKMEAYMY